MSTKAKSTAAAKSAQAPKATAPKGKAAKPATAPETAPAAPAPAPAVALRGGPAVQRVMLTGKAYRSAAKHNTEWWGAIVSACSVKDETGREDVPVQALLEAKVPAHFIGYTMRRGYLQAA